MGVQSRTAENGVVERLCPKLGRCIKNFTGLLPVSYAVMRQIILQFSQFLLSDDTRVTLVESLLHSPSIIHFKGSVFVKSAPHTRILVSLCRIQISELLACVKELDFILIP